MNEAAKGALRVLEIETYGRGGLMHYAFNLSDALARRGATVDLVEEDSGAEVTYQIVGVDEADIKAGLVSVSSPIARALIGKEEGDLATVVAPGGEKSFEIVEVRYE